MTVRPTFSRYRGDKVCPFVCVRFQGMESRGKRAVGNRTRSLMVPEARVSEVYELVAQALAGITWENELDSRVRVCSNAERQCE